MNKRLNYFSKKTKKFFIFLNLFFVICFLTFYIVYLYFNGNDNASISKILSILSLTCFFCLLVMNVINQTVELILRIKINKNVNKFNLSGQYDMTIKYLDSMIRINRYYNLNQLIAYYYAYTMMLKNEIDNSLLWLDEISIEKQYKINTTILAYSIFLKYMIYNSRNDIGNVINIYNTYLEKKNDILKSAVNKNKEEIHFIFSIIDDIEHKEFNKAKGKMESSKLIKIPFILEFLSK